MSEEDILKAISLVDLEIKEYRLKVSQYRELMLNYETELIAQKLRKTQLEEQLRILLEKKVPIEIDDYSLEIEEFRKKYPALVEWANNGRKSD